MKKVVIKEQLVYVLIGSVFLIVLLIFSTFMVDSLTKKAKLVEIQTQRIATNEKLRVFGVVKNVGSFFITKCYLTVVATNKTKGLKLGGVAMFKSRGFSDVSKKTKSGKLTAISYEKLVGKSLKPKAKQRFSFYFKYPSYFKSMIYKYYLNCK